MKFRRTNQRYGATPAPETPYQKASQLWDERIGAARVQARNWRLMAIGSLVLAGGLAASTVWQASQSRVIPYVVEVDRLGSARAVAPVGEDYRPTDPQIAWHLAAFVRKVRSVSTDPAIVRENWLEAYDYVTKRGAVTLGGYARAADPFAGGREASVSIQVTSVVRASDRSFQVKWIERRFERGNLVDTGHWTGILTIKIDTPRTAERVRKNPLGLYIDAIDWSREIDAAPPPAPARPLQPVPADAPTPQSSPDNGAADVR
ncbi:conjugal transfer protein TrbF [Sphingomonas colocasiae]|uniref:Conjugal transfer protein TrbF n=1 Tax=Sphingomonas colocasiae TaxID=1848973 RepID=A0ABS7PIF0_9SPHN|nr:conjugal transfer protein TrbF [Sphingomonas colocasiae]MBY8821082.1 conjugal transfer protein TrbF [Sphingomonas colocasiae]